jgi:hypothetical protein
MFVDCGTKEMSTEHLRRILSECRWSYRYNQEFVEQDQIQEGWQESGCCPSDDW